MRPLAVSLGCPAGIGPEVAVAAAAEAAWPLLLVGDPAVVRRAAGTVGVDEARLILCEDASQAIPEGRIGVFAQSHRLASLPPPGEPGRDAGAAQLAWIDQALTLVREGRAAALVTGPVSKDVIAGSGAPGAEGFAGHTEYLRDRLGADEVVMAFVGGPLRLSLVTTHLPLREVADAVTPEGVARASYWLARLLVDLGEAEPQIVVAALNPHAGEGGRLGDEESRVIAPGMALGRARLAAAGVAASLVGPMGAETAMRLAAAGELSGVVAMYHDQGTIPLKLLGFGEAVNVSLGLPIVRTSVDHGTGYDRAGLGTASPAGMREALALAARLSKA